jgi:hypothetical protein
MLMFMFILFTMFATSVVAYAARITSIPAHPQSCAATNTAINTTVCRLLTNIRKSMYNVNTTQRRVATTVKHTLCYTHCNNKC